MSPRPTTVESSPSIGARIDKAMAKVASLENELRAAKVDLKKTYCHLRAQVANLSRREQAVMELLLEGKVSKEIAVALGIEVRTVKFHISSIYAKTGCHNRLALIMSEMSNSTKGEHT